MPFALGVAIANLFQRIADLLNQQTFPQAPPSGGGGGSGGGSGGGGGGNQPPQNPPPPTGPGTGPPQVVTIPAVNQFPGYPDPYDCPPLSAVDMDALVNLPSLLPPALLPQSSAILTLEPEIEVGNMLATGQGIIVEEEDYFRFRAFGSAGAIPVSFFGRVQGSSGNIRPFNHTVTTDALGTIFETLPRPGRGVLLGAAASVPVGSITSGAVNAIGEIGRIAGATFTPHTLLFSGQLDGVAPLSNTLATPSLPTANPTFRTFQTIDTDPTGLFVSVAVTPGKRARILQIRSSIVMSATAGNRQVWTRTNVGGEDIWTGFADRVFTAGQWALVRFCMNGQQGSPTVTQQALAIGTSCSLPETLFFTADFTVEVALFTFAGNDLLTNAYVYTEET